MQCETNGINRRRANGLIRVHARPALPRPPRLGPADRPPGRVCLEPPLDRAGRRLRRALLRGGHPLRRGLRDGARRHRSRGDSVLGPGRVPRDRRRPAPRHRHGPCVHGPGPAPHVARPRRPLRPARDHPRPRSDAEPALLRLDRPRDCPGRRPASRLSRAPGTPWLQASTSAWRPSPRRPRPLPPVGAPAVPGPGRGGAGRCGHSPSPRMPATSQASRRSPTSTSSRSPSRRPRSRSRSASSGTGSSTSHPWPARRSSSGSRSGCSSSTGPGAWSRRTRPPPRSSAPGTSPSSAGPSTRWRGCSRRCPRSSPPAERPRPRCTTPFATAPSPSRRPRSTPERTRHGGTVVLIGDITARRRAEEGLVRRTADLEAANRRLSLVSTFTRHDLANHLVALEGYLSLLREDPRGPSAPELVERLAEAVDRVRILSGFMRDYPAIGVQPPQLARAPGHGRAGRPGGRARRRRRRGQPPGRCRARRSPARAGLRDPDRERGPPRRGRDEGPARSRAGRRRPRPGRRGRRCRRPVGRQGADLRTWVRSEHRPRPLPRPRDPREHGDDDRRDRRARPRRSVRDPDSPRKGPIRGRGRAGGGGTALAAQQP